MQVGVLSRRIDLVDVEIDRRRPHAQPGDAGLLRRLPQRHRREVGVSVGVTARLDPDLQLRVEEDQGCVPQPHRPRGRSRSGGRAVRCGPAAAAVPRAATASGSGRRAARCRRSRRWLPTHRRSASTGRARRRRPAGGGVHEPSSATLPASGGGRLTSATPATANRHGRSPAAETPTRPPIAGDAGGAVPSSRIDTPCSAAVRSSPSWAPSSPNAWAILAGPLVRSTSRRARRSSGPHRLPAPQRREGPQQDGAGHTVDVGDDVGTPVHAVGEVHVEVARPSEHHRGSRGDAAEGVAGRVIGPLVRLGLDDPAGETGRDEHLVEQVGRGPRAPDGRRTGGPGGGSPVEVGLQLVGDRKSA